MVTITTDEEHTAALKEVDKLWGCTLGTPEHYRLEELAAALDAYEKARWPMD